MPGDEYGPDVKPKRKAITGQTYAGSQARDPAEERGAGPSVQQSIRPPTATPLNVYGNNAAVACPCGQIVVVRSMGSSGKGARQCPSCPRWYKGHPEEGKPIVDLQRDGTPPLQKLAPGSASA